MKNKRISDHSILKMNKNESLSININEINATFKILKNNEKQYSVIKEKLQISKDKINDTIKEHHDESLYEHFDVNKTLQLLRRNCAFFNMKQHVETYIKKCFNCQKNKHFTHAKYDKMQYRKSSKKS